MKIHYTGRQVEISPKIRSQIEEKLNKIHRIAGARLDLEAHVTLTLERYRYSSEITVSLKNHPLVVVSANHDCYVCVQDALEKLEKQAIKYKGRGRELKRRPKTAWAAEEAAAGEPAGRAAGAAAGGAA